MGRGGRQDIASVAGQQLCPGAVLRGLADGPAARGLRLDQKGRDLRSQNSLGSRVTGLLRGLTPTQAPLDTSSLAPGTSGLLQELTFTPDTWLPDIAAGPWLRWHGLWERACCRDSLRSSVLIWKCGREGQRQSEPPARGQEVEDRGRTAIDPAGEGPAGHVLRDLLCGPSGPGAGGQGALRAPACKMGVHSLSSSK